MSTPAENIDTTEQVVDQTGKVADQVTDKPAETSTWPEQWREAYAGQDEKKLSKLNRYTSPTAAFDALIAAQDRIRSGELKTPFPEKGSDEEKSRWRVENGLPESADKYDLTYDDGLVIGEEDKPVIDDFLKSAYETNMSPSQVKSAVRWYHEQVIKQEEQAAEIDQQEKQATEDALRAEWGADYKGIQNRIESLFDRAPGELKAQILNGRLADGTPIKASVDAMKYLADLAVEINPVTTLIPGSGANITGALEDEIAKIEKVMRENRQEYNRDERMQERLRKLYAAREKAQR